MSGGCGPIGSLSIAETVIYSCLVVVLVLASGLMSGLVLGLLSLDEVDIEVLLRTGTASEKRWAQRVLPVIGNPNHLLCSLLLFMAACNETLPIFMDKLVDTIIAIIISTTAILFFCEIIPQAVCAQYGLIVGGIFAPFVRFIMVITFPVSWPLGRLLDLLLGQKSPLLGRRQLKALFDLHHKDAGLGGNLSLDEVNVIKGALDMTVKTVQKSMTPLDKAFMLSTEDRLDEATRQAILDSGHSRIPVHQGGNRKDIVGLVLAKELVQHWDAEEPPLLRDIVLRPLLRVPANTPMFDVLNLFQTGRSHMALVVTPYIHMAASPGAGAVALELGRASEGSVDRRLQQQEEQQQRQGERGYFTVADAGVTVAPKPGLAARAALEDERSTNVLGISSDMLRSHEPVGLVTIEDIIEELMQEEIVDETDQYVDNLQTVKVNLPLLSMSLPPQLRTMLQAGHMTISVAPAGHRAA